MATSFAAVLRERRCAAGLSRPQLARRATVPAVSIAHLEKGYVTNPGSRTVARLARALGVSPSVLLTPFVSAPVDTHAAGTDSSP
jgi:transcriptional regulator with XRE-family HTH domain